MLPAPMRRLALTLAMALPLTPGLSLAQSSPDALLARNLAATCANCHGTHGQALAT